MYQKELSYYFSSITAYIVIGLFLVATGLFLWVIPGNWNIPDSGYASVDGLFALSPWLLMLLCPALTMHIFAMEFSTGTWDLLLTKPMSLRRILAGKYFAALTVAVMALLPCIIHYVAVGCIAEPSWNIDSGVFFGSFCGLIMLACAFTAIGVFASALGKNQIVAMITGVVCCFILFYGFDLLASTMYGSVANAVEWFSLNHHYLSISRGIIDLGDIVYFLSVSIVFIICTHLILTIRNRK